MCMPDVVRCDGTIVGWCRLEVGVVSSSALNAVCEFVLMKKSNHLLAESLGQCPIPRRPQGPAFVKAPRKRMHTAAGLSPWLGREVCSLPVSTAPPRLSPRRRHSHRRMLLNHLHDIVALHPPFRRGPAFVHKDCFSYPTWFSWRRNTVADYPFLPNDPFSPRGSAGHLGTVASSCSATSRSSPHDHIFFGERC